jgi:hypothetical protein
VFPVWCGKGAAGTGILLAVVAHEDELAVREGRNERLDDLDLEDERRSNEGHEACQVAEDLIKVPCGAHSRQHRHQSREPAAPEGPPVRFLTTHHVHVPSGKAASALWRNSCSTG